MYSSSVNLDKSIGDIEPSLESRDSSDLCALSSSRLFIFCFCFCLVEFKVLLERRRR